MLDELDGTITVLVRCTYACRHVKSGYKPRCMLETIVRNSHDIVELIDHKNFGALFGDCRNLSTDEYSVEAVAMHESPKGDVKRDRSFECKKCDRRCILSYDDEDMDLDPFIKCPFGMKGSFFIGDMDRCDMVEL